VDFTLSFSGTGFRNQHLEHNQEHEVYWHDLEMTTGDISLATSLGLSRRFGIDALVAFRLNRERVTFRSLDGLPYEPDPPDVHHENRTLVGLADPWLMAHVGDTWGAWSVGARAGATLPLGETVPDPFELGEQYLPHEHIQFGSGTLQPLGTLAVARDFGAWALSARGLVHLGLWTNQHGYRAGNQWLGTLVGTSKLGTMTWSFEAGPTIYRENAETWGGEVQYEGNLGRTDVYADARVNHALTSSLSLGAEFRVPMYSEAVGAQLDVPLTFRLSATTGFMWRTP
jgi:hypothetical protein